MKKVKSPLKFHGGKFHMVNHLLSLMPPRGSYVHFVETFFGSGAVLFGMNPDGVSEVVNDIDRQLISFWQVLGDQSLFPAFVRAAQATPFSQPTWETAGALLDSVDPVTRAWAFFVRCRQSLAGRMEDFAPLSRRRTRRGMNEQASAWLSAVDGLPAVHERLRRVAILCRDALDVIRAEDGPLTVYYIDPPYLQSTRTAPHVFRHEVDEEYHSKLLDLLGTVEGYFLLSGYRSDLYDAAAAKYNWVRHDFKIVNHASGAKKKRMMVESVWTKG